MPESGDAIQTLKAGVMEIADVYLVNKADRDGASQMATAITGMLHMSPVTPEWVPPVMLTTAHTGQGIEELWGKVEEHQEFLKSTGALDKRRGQQRKNEFLEAVEEELGRRLRQLVEQDPDLNSTLDKVARKEAEPYSSALEFLNASGPSPKWFSSLSNEQSQQN